VGWAHMVIDKRAFYHHLTKVLPNVLDWDTGEFDGTEHANITECVRLVREARYGEMPFHSKTDVVTEDFELTQMIGGENLLSPVRINALLEWEVSKVGGVSFHYQKRQMRTGITPERLKAMGFASPMNRGGNWTRTGKGKDSFAAMQHAIVWVRRVKQEANRRPWKAE